MIARIPRETRTEHMSNTNLENYRYTKPLSHCGGAAMVTPRVKSLNYCCMSNPFRSPSFHRANNIK
jgi:hypothetical protein